MIKFIMVIEVHSPRKKTDTQKKEIIVLRPIRDRLPVCARFGRAGPYWTGLRQCREGTARHGPR